jgi:hypothetical protein
VLRLIAFAVIAIIGVLAAAYLFTRLFPAPPASQRLAGVSVQLVRYAIDGGPAAVQRPHGPHRLDVTLEVSSVQAIAECMAFTLDEPFGGRRLEPLVEGKGACIAPVAGTRTVELTFDALTDDDLGFPSHTVVWGVRGGSCGLILEAIGICVVEQAGTVPLELPRPAGLPSFGPIGSFFPLFSFEPIP